MSIDKMDLLIKAQELRKRLCGDMDSPIDIFTIAYTIEGLTIVLYPMGENLSGMCVKGINGNVIAINSEKTLGRQHFSLAHEFYHLFYDENMTAICSATIGTGTDIEKSADQFASYFLIPPVLFNMKVESYESIGIREVVVLEQYFGVSRKAILNRLLDEGKVTQEQVNYLKDNVIRSATSLGYTDDLYRPLPKEKQYGTYGSLIEQANEALEKDLISDGKYEEILLQAFRADLVYGEDEGGDPLD